MTAHRDLGLTRPNYILDPAKDFSLFARSDISPGDLAESLKVDLMTEVAPKRVFYGPYGSGKTHTLYNTVNLLEDSLPVFPIYVECPDLPRNSSFHDFYRDGIMRVFGQTFVCGLLSEYVRGQPAKPLTEMLADLKDDIPDEALATAMMKLYGQPSSQLVFWSWISGHPVRGSDLKVLEQSYDLTAAEPSVLAGVIIAIATVLRKIRNKFLVLMLDELERMRNINVDGQQTFATAFTRLTEQNQRSLSVLFGVSVEQIRDAGYLFSAVSPVTSRLGAESQVRVPPMPNSNVDHFIIEVIRYVRDPSADIAALLARASQAHAGQTFTKEFFPFATQAIDAIKMKLGQHNTPREINYFMTRALGRAMLRDHVAVVEADV